MRDKAELWRSRIEDQIKSGESVRGYCLKRGVTESSLSYWKKRLQPAASVVSRAAVGSGGREFVRIDKPPEPIELLHPSGIIIKVSLEQLPEVLRCFQ